MREQSLRVSGTEDRPSIQRSRKALGLEKEGDEEPQ